ncbi:glycosyltransferase family 2 protein [Variovorax ginsengisoli]|uniref:Glycosyltransferase family 2 protein n=1 Tax=Variovorax ginsengisoli TaxID=363844 RepID=A0ABT8SCS6_9BURK|nr:glycosyltransferase family 2 protein [Variovorax ginsengisoli]MDN8617539.1 glycosyltransferase family 2 protein [Variovorax ginsengisoli]MDO1536709.1 glycosyltransferase family 2 protein [Variovorax ginsengisoli]
MLTLVIPVYRNEASIPDLLDAVAGLHRDLQGQMEAVFVIDGSPDRCFELLRDALPGRPFPSKLALLTRNFGSFPAIRAGLALVESDRYAVMAADLQEPPELVLQMDQALRNEPVDVVVATREGREDPLSSRLPAQIFWWLYRKYVIPEMPPGGVDVFGCNRAFRDSLLRLDERHSSLVAQIFWLGFRRKLICYSRRLRQHGKSAWTFKKKLNYLMDSVFSFTDLPIRLLVRVGGTTAMLAGLLGIVVTIGKLMGLISVPGYAMTILTIVFLGAVNLFGLGIVGSYAWRIYENTKGRPHTVTLRVDEFNRNV